MNSNYMDCMSRNIERHNRKALYYANSCRGKDAGLAANIWDQVKSRTRKRVLPRGKVYQRLEQLQRNKLFEQLQASLQEALELEKERGFKAVS